MSLATRCTTCGTVFRVVQDQLRISEGWVRCGRCEAVFNALPTLFDLERDPPPPWPPALPPEAAPPPALPAEHPQQPGGPDLDPEDDWPPPAPVRPEPTAALTEPHAAVMPTPMPAADNNIGAWADNPDPIAAAQQPPVASVPLDEPSPWTDPVAEPRSGRDDPLLSAPLAEDTLTITSYHPPEAAAPPPRVAQAEAGPAGFAFLREAERRARWQHPRVRAGLALGSALAAVLLVLQASLFFRNELAARSPLAATVLQGLCSSLGCRIGAPLDIEAVTVESSSLSRIAASSEAVRLSLTLRNRGSTVVAMPAVDLNLTDGSGQLVARRALLPADFRVTSEGLKPGAETALQVVLQAGQQRVTGYSVELFYP